MGKPAGFVSSALHPPGIVTDDYLLAADPSYEKGPHGVLQVFPKESMDRKTGHVIESVAYSFIAGAIFAMLWPAT
jgi:hypothetical protein